jgi:hypothetical protein
MIIADALKLSQVALASLAASGPIATAALSVDIASNFAVTTTVAALALTLPTPTDASAGDHVIISNAAANTNTYTVNGFTIRPAEFAVFVWNGTTWLNADGGRNQGAVITLATMTVGSNAILHNLAMPTGTFSNLAITALNSTGSQVFFKRVTASDVTNSAFVTTPVAVSTPTTFYITPLI